MDLARRLLAHYGYINKQTGELVDIDVAGLLTNLLLFDECVIHSQRLNEVPRLIELFNYRGLLELLKSGVLRFQPVRVMAVHIDEHAPDLNPKPGEWQAKARLVLEPTEQFGAIGHHKLSVVKIGEPATDIAEGLRVVDGLAGLSANRRQRLEQALAGAIPPLPEELWTNATEQTQADLDHGALGLAEAVQRCLRSVRGEPPRLETLQLAVHREDQVQVYVESNLTSDLGLRPEQAHMVIGNALLALARLNVRLGFMQAMSGISGFQDDESSFIQRKLDFVLRSLQPANRIERFSRLVQVGGLPDIASAIQSGALDVDRLLEVRNSREGREFRAWLRNLEEGSEGEAVERVRSLRSRFGAALGSLPGRVTRFAAVTGVSTVPIGAAAGIGIGALDQFLLDRLLPHSGPAAFMNRLYPSIFEPGRL
jgi:hypothetical protein